MVAGKFTLEQNDTVTMAIGQMGTSTAGPVVAVEVSLF